jgi:hypothetical protein
MTMASDLESEVSPAATGTNGRPSGWLRVGMVAAASALAGGLAAAWYYRKTLARMRQAEENTPDPDPDDLDYDI